MLRVRSYQVRSYRQLRAAVVVVWVLLMASSLFGLMHDATEGYGLAGTILGTILFLCVTF